MALRVRDPDKLRDLGQRVAVAVLEHDDGPVPRRQLLDELLQLQPARTGRRAVGERHEGEQLLQPAAAALDAKRAVNADPRQPGLHRSRVTQLGDPRPGREVRVLDDVLRGVRPNQ